MEYGPEIPVNGKRPEFVRDDDCFMALQDDMWLECEDAGYFWSPFSVIRLKSTHPYYATQINYDLPVQTRDGRAVRILCTDAPGDYPVVGIMDGGVMTWKLNGEYQSKDGPLHLQNVPASPVRVSRWMGVSETVESVEIYEDEGIVDHWPNHVELIFEDGNLVEAIVHG